MKKVTNKQNSFNHPVGYGVCVRVWWGCEGAQWFLSTQYGQMAPYEALGSSQPLLAIWGTFPSVCFASIFLFFVCVVF